MDDNDDPDFVRYQQAIDKKDPTLAFENIEAIEGHLRYGIASIKFQLWIVIIFLGLILWQVWR